MSLTTVQAGILGSDSQYTGFKNRIINGAMMIDQRNAGASVTVTDAYTLDRWEVREDTDGAASCQQVSDAPTGFSFSQKFTTTTADASLTTTQRFFVGQNIEGFNTADLAFGTASAQTVTLSFWVKSSLTGTFAGALQNSARSRSYVFNYTINAANAWEQKTVTIVGDTTGTWIGATNGIGLRVCFAMGIGPDYSGTANSWQSAALWASTGAVSVIGTLNATFQVTGVQLEKGSTATSFDYRPYGTELSLCQRYYCSSFSIGTAPANGLSDNRGATLTCFNGNYFQSNSIRFPVSMRTVPTTTLYNSGTTASVGYWTAYNGSWQSLPPAGNTVSDNTIQVIVGGGAFSASYGQTYIGSGYWTASAEL